MGLEDLNDQLYSREHADDRKLAETPFDIQPKPSQEPTPDAKTFELVGIQKLTWKERLGNFWRAHSKTILISAGIAIVLIGAGVAFYLWFGKFFSEQNIAVTLNAPNATASGSDVTFQYHLANNNRARLENATLHFEYPKEFMPAVNSDWQTDGNQLVHTVGTIDGHGELSGSITGKFFGNKDAVSTVHMTLSYTPQNLSGSYEKSVDAAVRIDSSPLTIEVNAPQQLITGKQLDYEVTYRNTGNESYDNMRITAEFPTGFTFQSADPRSTNRDQWTIGTLAPGQSGKIVITGTLDGQWNEFKSANFKLGYFDGTGQFVSYNESSAQTQMVASPLSVKQIVNDQESYTANLGETLRYSIEYANNGDIGLRDVIVTMHFDDPYVNWSKLTLDKGSADERTRTITWKASDIEGLRFLQPGAKGTISFTIPILSTLPGNAESATIKTVAQADSPDVPAIISQNKIISSNTLLVKLGTAVQFGVEWLYHDDKINDSGPLPPEVDKTTTFVARTTVKNTGNDLTQAKVVFVLPGFMKYTGVINPANEALSYNSRTDEVTWDIGTLGAGQEKTVRFQLGFTPTQSQAGTYYDLLGQAVLTGTDSFTKQPIEMKIPGGNIDIEKSDSVPGGANKVKE